MPRGETHGARGNIQRVRIVSSLLLHPPRAAARIADRPRPATGAGCHAFLANPGRLGRIFSPDDVRLGYLFQADPGRLGQDPGQREAQPGHSGRCSWLVVRGLVVGCQPGRGVGFARVIARTGAGVQPALSEPRSRSRFIRAMMSKRDFLGADRLALAVCWCSCRSPRRPAATMRTRAAVPLGLALRQQAEVGDLGGGEQHGRGVRAGGHAGAAADAGGGVHGACRRPALGTGMALRVRARCRWARRRSRRPG